MASTNADQSPRRLAGLVYLLYILGFLFGITALIGVIINHTLIGKTKGSIAYSHFCWQIVSFWVLFAGVVLTIALWPGSAAMAFAIGSLVWWVLTALCGSYLLAKKKPLPFFNKFTTG